MFLGPAPISLHFPFSLSILGPGGLQACCPLSQVQIGLDNSLTGAYRKAGEELFIRACINRMRGKDFKLEDIRKKWFTVQVVRHWNKLASEVVNVGNLGKFCDLTEPRQDKNTAVIAGSFPSFLFKRWFFFLASCGNKTLKIASKEH